MCAHTVDFWDSAGHPESCDVTVQYIRSESPCAVNTFTIIHLLGKVGIVYIVNSVKMQADLIVMQLALIGWASKWHLSIFNQNQNLVYWPSVLTHRRSLTPVFSVSFSAF